MIARATLAAGALALVGAAPPARLPGYTVKVTLTPRAAAKLAALKETIIVSASYFAEANARGRSHADTMGEIAWAKDVRVELRSAGTARLAPPRPIPGRLRWAKTPQVLINVFSGRRTLPDNLLDCGIFQDSVQVAARSGIRIRCDLIR